MPEKHTPASHIAIATRLKCADGQPSRLGLAGQPRLDLDRRFRTEDQGGIRAKGGVVCDHIARPLIGKGPGTGTRTGTGTGGYHLAKAQALTKLH
jgi:hypothetical protein